GGGASRPRPHESGLRLDRLRPLYPPALGVSAACESLLGGGPGRKPGMSPRLAVVPELESELDDLFARPLSEFTTARNELSRRLKKAGQEEAATRVQALKKPSVPVWAVNQLARRHQDEVKELVDA